MKLLKLFLFLSAFSFITSCSPESLPENQTNVIDVPQATNDNSITIDNGSRP